MSLESVNPEEYLKELFEVEYCGECEGDWYDHDLIMLNLGHYGIAPFARCKIAVDPNYKVRRVEET